MREIQELKYSRVDIGEINQLAAEDAAELVRASEEYYNAQVMKAAIQIKQRVKTCRFVLLCGPSASGKTTTAHKLKHRLISQGVGALVVSMDNFFLGVEQYPKLPDGSPDMESLYAIDLELLNNCFDELFEKGRAMFPTYDFTTSSLALQTQEVTLKPGDVIILEGIHALNPEILSHIPRESIFRLYVSVRTKFLSGEEEVLSPKDIRLMRRMVRDNKFRNYPPSSTLKQWGNVLAGERANINPFRDDVDLKMDNTLDYEVCVWHDMLTDLLAATSQGELDENPELQRLFAGLCRFEKISQTLIPKNSLLREFIG